jgi:hypothetical protein
MANIDHFVQVTVSKTSASVTQQGFGRPLWLGLVDISIIPGRVAVFSSPSELVTAGVAVTDPVYLWAQTLQGQAFSPVDFAVGRRAIGSGAAQVDTVLISAADTGLWTLTIDAVVYSYTADGDDTELTIAQGLMDAITAADASLTANGTAVTVPGGTLVSATFTVTAWVAGEAFVNGGIVDGDAGTGTFVSTTANAAVENITDALNAVVLENDDWYGLNIESRQDADILLANTWVASQLKVLVAQSVDADILTTAGGDIGSQLGATSNTRTQLMYHFKPKQFADGAMLGRALAANLDGAAPGAGQITWALKQLQVIFVNPLNTTQLTNLEANNADTYVFTKGRGVVWLGQSVEGEFMDVQTTLDWTQSRVGEAIFAVLATTPTKVPLDNQGISTVSGAGLGVMMEGVTNAHFLGDDPAFPRASSPKSTDISTANRNARILPNILYEAVIQGAIHKVIVQVNLEA